MRVALKLPTGRLPYGSEELDLGASLLGGFRWTSAAVRLHPYRGAELTLLLGLRSRP
jgi:hypothetical protein